MSPCDFYPDGRHHFVRTFWGMACDRCGEVSDHDPETTPPPTREEELESELLTTS